MVGETLADRYLVKERTWGGEFLSTYTALDKVSGIEVEIDVLARPMSECNIPASRLEEILDAAMHLRGPHICPMHGWGEEAEGGFVYVVREKAGGAALAEVLACTGELPRQQVVEIARAAVAVLAEAYGGGLFYLGLNPGQVLLDGKGGIRFNRAGFAWILEESEPALAARVSPYRPPETDGAKEGSRTSDVYSLAVMVREMLPEEVSGGRLGSLLEMAMDPLPRRRPTSPRLLLEELEAGEKESAAGSPATEAKPSNDDLERGGGLAFLESSSPLSVADLARRPRRRMLRNLLLILSGGMALWLAFAALAGLLGGDGSQEPQVQESAADMVELPDLQGLTFAEAEELLEGMGLACTSREAPSRLWSAGRVAAQEPAEGSMLRPGDMICLVVSTGSDTGVSTVPPETQEPSPPETTPSSSGGDEASTLPEALPQPSPQAPVSTLPAPAPNTPPRAVPAISSNSGSAPLHVIMDGSASYDPDGSVVRYVWHCGDGTVIEGIRAQHVYDPAVIPARFEVLLEVYDTSGMSDSRSTTLEVY
jgi:eukaryotic-like serine/threonine-protein kinase